MSKKYEMSFEDFIKLDFSKSISSATKSTLNSIPGVIQEAIIPHYVPVDSGKLRDSFEIKEYKDKRVLGTELEYAPVVEHGSRNTKGTHFFERSINDFTEEEIEEIYLDVLESMMEIDFK